MELRYRGVNYQSSVSAIAPLSSHPCGTYRGLPIGIHQAHTAIPDAVTLLHYRGCLYLGERFGVKPNAHLPVVNCHELER
ncbi:MAG: DUF4278 domain-containing protein [Elainellaceae cyanobacterium]